MIVLRGKTKKAAPLPEVIPETKTKKTEEKKPEVKKTEEKKM